MFDHPSGFVSMSRSVFYQVKSNYCWLVRNWAGFMPISWNVWFGGGVDVMMLMVYWDFHGHIQLGINRYHMKQFLHQTNPFTISLEHIFLYFWKDQLSKSRDVHDDVCHGDDVCLLVGLSPRHLIQRATWKSEGVMFVCYVRSFPHQKIIVVEGMMSSWWRHFWCHVRRDVCWESLLKNKEAYRSIHHWQAKSPISMPTPSHIFFIIWKIQVL